MKYLLFVPLAIAAQSAFASLSPYWDSALKIQTIINSEDVSEAVLGKPITSISAKEALAYLVETESCQITVRLEAHMPKQGHVGPTTYEVDGIEKSDCK